MTYEHEPDDIEMDALIKGPSILLALGLLLILTSVYFVEDRIEAVRR